MIFTHFHQPINGRSMLVRSPPTEFPCPTSAPLSSTTSPGLNVLPTGEKAFRAPTVGRVLKAIIVIVVQKSKKSDQSVEGKKNTKNNINRKIQNNSVIARKCSKIDDRLVMPQCRQPVMREANNNIFLGTLSQTLLAKYRFMMVYDRTPDSWSMEHVIIGDNVLDILFHVAKAMTRMCTLQSLATTV